MPPLTHLRQALFAGPAQHGRARRIDARAIDRAADKFDAEAAMQVVDADKVPAGWRMLDIGPKSIAAFSDVLRSA